MLVGSPEMDDMPAIGASQTSPAIPLHRSLIKQLLCCEIKPSAGVSERWVKFETNVTPQVGSTHSSLLKPVNGFVRLHGRL